MVGGYPEPPPANRTALLRGPLRKEAVAVIQSLCAELRPNLCAAGAAYTRSGYGEYANVRCRPTVIDLA
jgi:hypothetical protein